MSQSSVSQIIFSASWKKNEHVLENVTRQKTHSPTIDHDKDDRTTIVSNHRSIPWVSLLTRRKRRRRSEEVGQEACSEEIDGEEQWIGWKLHRIGNALEQSMEREWRNSSRAEDDPYLEKDRCWLSLINGTRRQREGWSMMIFEFTIRVIVRIVRGRRRRRSWKHSRRLRTKSVRSSLFIFFLSSRSIPPVDVSFSLSLMFKVIDHTFESIVFYSISRKSDISQRENDVIRD